MTTKNDKTSAPKKNETKKNETKEETKKDEGVLQKLAVKVKSAIRAGRPTRNY